MIGIQNGKKVCLEIYSLLTRPVYILTKENAVKYFY
jgi:hypothetical protein